MTQAKALLDAGKRFAGHEEVTREVKASPGDTSAARALFELLCSPGDWERAEKQLDVTAIKVRRPRSACRLPQLYQG